MRNTVIILTRDKNSGKRLQESLEKHHAEHLGTVEAFIKEDILCNPQLFCETEFIFSTWYMPEFSNEEIGKFFPKLKAVFYAAGTVKYFALPFFANGVRVYAANSANGVPVAEFTAAQIILSNKGYFQAQQSYRWPMLPHMFKKSRSYAEHRNGNYLAKIGIIGCGAIGSMVIKLLSQHKLLFYTYDPYLSDERAMALGVKKAGLDELFSTCDVISNHLPDIPDTQGLINYQLLSKMKPYATFINTGRGKQVVEKDLAKILRERSDTCALLDVTTHEPLYPWSPLYWCRNLYLTPHIAGSTSNEYLRLVEYMVQAYLDFRENRENPCKIQAKDINHKA